MKYALALLFALLAVSSVQNQGIPIRECPPGEHSVLYCPPAAEPTCEVPTVHELTGPGSGICDSPQCFCDTPTVRNTQTGKCVNVAQCGLKANTFIP